MPGEGHPRIRTLASAAVALSALALALAGCGGDDDDDGGGGGGGGGYGAADRTATEKTATEEAASKPAGKARSTVTEVATDFKFSQPSPSAKSGTVVMKLSNEGRAPHAIELEGAGDEVVSDTVAPGGSTSLEARLPPGSYEFYCPVGNHKQLGMTGEITVR